MTPEHRVGWEPLALQVLKVLKVTQEPLALQAPKVPRELPDPLDHKGRRVTPGRRVRPELQVPRVRRDLLVLKVRKAIPERLAPKVHKVRGELPALPVRRGSRDYKVQLVRKDLPDQHLWAQSRSLPGAKAQVLLDKPCFRRIRLLPDSST